jgi:hypothetical protein
MEKIKWSEKVTSEQVPERIGEKWTPLNILHRKANWIGHIQRKNCLLGDVIDEQMMEVKGAGRRRRRRRQLLDDEQQKKIIVGKGENWRSKKLEKTDYHMKIRKK